MTAQQWQDKVRQVAIRKVAKVFDDADCDVEILHMVGTGLVMIVNLDFGQTNQCCCTEVLDQERLESPRSGKYVGQVLDHMIHQLLAHTGRD